MGHDLIAVIARVLTGVFLGIAILLLLMCSARAQSVFADGFEPKQAACPPLPAGFRVEQKTWEHLFFGASWPNQPAHLSPIGSWSLRSGNPPRGRPIAGVLITSPIFMDGGPTHKIDWVNAQVITAAGYRTPYAAMQVNVVVSRCRADWRADPPLAPKTVCGGSASSGALFYGPAASAPECRFPPAEPLWVTFHFSWPDLMSPELNTCNPLNASQGVLCDANFGSR